MLISVDAMGGEGLITDLQSHSLPPNAWSNGRNIRFSHGEISKVPGQRTVATLNTDAFYMLPLISGTEYYWLLCSSLGITSWDGTTQRSISPATLTEQASGWNGGVLAGVAVLNPQSTVPVYYAESMPFAAPLPGWDEGWRAGVIRPYKNFWIAGNMTEDGTNYPTRYRWSAAAEPGAVPTEWIASATNQAGDDVLEETQGEIIEFEPLRDYLVAYKEDATFILHYVGGSFVISNRLVLKTRGILAQRCAKEFLGKHFVVTAGDIIVHDGQNADSVVTGRVQRSIFSEIDDDRYPACFVAPNYKHEEMWFCYPESGNDWPNVAAIWNWRSGKWSFRDLPGAQHISYGIIPSSAASDTWEADDGTWLDWAQAWNEKVYDPVDQSLIMLRSNDDALVPAEDLYPSDTLYPDGGTSNLMVADFSLSFDGDDINAFVERRGLKPGNKDGVFMCRAVYPRGDGGDIRVTIGSHSSPNSPVVWCDPVVFSPGGSADKVDVRVTGRYLAAKFEFIGDTGILYGADFDVVQVGAR